ncbi:PspC domain-containing protein [Sphingomonas sp.]|uniref:PspC domain-containing protein n=1 Tax=Sphingomonas sp. TaxID=28214 RepID=UPI001857FCE9|nr:PspC domain-containing protein [Sphingomonas sp.]MBA3510358.1 PspC domain-containing protein [Sphingomonas sp.]
MARKTYRYSLNRRDAKLVGVCSTLGERFGIDPTFIRVGFVAAVFLISWEVALVTYAALGIYFTIQRKREVDGSPRRSEFDRMADTPKVRPTVHAMRTELDATDRRLMAIDDHLATPNHELAREIDALREEK